MAGTDAPIPHPVWGHLPAFNRDVLAFLTECAQSPRDAVPLRFLHLPAALLLDPVAIERVLVSEHPKFTKPAWLKTRAVLRLLGHGLVTTDGAEWRAQRHVCSPAFHRRRLDDYASVIARLAEQTVSEWKVGEPFDLQRTMSRLTLRVIANTLIGADPPGWPDEAANAMDSLMARFSGGIRLFGMTPIPPGASEFRAARTLNRIVESLITVSDSARSENSPPSLLSDLRESGAPASDVRDQLKTFLGAGYESSALTLTWALLVLASHPRQEEALTREVASVLHEGSNAAGDALRLPYAEAVVKEILRLYPPLWMTGREAKESCSLGGLAVRRGTLVMTSQWAVHRSARLFPCPHEFRPERWLDGSCAQLPRFAYFPFGGGPRVCIGQSFAMMETVLILAIIIRRVRIELTVPSDLSPWATMTLRPLPGIQVRAVTRREH